MILASGSLLESRMPVEKEAATLAGSRPGTVGRVEGLAAILNGAYDRYAEHKRKLTPAQRYVRKTEAD